jgi:transmembrane sensor
MSGEATDEDQQRWQQWRAAHADHDRAWQHLEAVTGRLRQMEPKAAYKVLSPYTSPPAGTGAPGLAGRRKVLRLVMWSGVASATGLLASRTQTWQQTAADHRTGTGEQRSLMLDDGSQITLNTGSAINVRFDDTRRLVRLVGGEVLIVTGHAARGSSAETRPFIVETTQGAIRALGTRFAIRHLGGHAHVAVLENAVEIMPRDAPDQARVLQAGEHASFTRNTLDTLPGMDDQSEVWWRGQMVADNMRLADFLGNLSRYRPGLLRCDPAAADLRISGVFPLHDTDRILATLPSVLPVQVRLRTRYWVTIEAAR